MRIEDKTIRALASALNLRQMRQELISANIANAETPNYKAKRIDFEDALAMALDVDGTNRMDKSDKRHISVGGGGLDSLEPTIYDDPNGVVREDGNTVDREQEMARMSQNKILYDAAVQLLNKKLGLMKYTISSER